MSIINKLEQIEKRELFDKEYKKCGKCKEIKSLDLFFKNRAAKDGRCSMCKKCRKLYSEEHKEEQKQYYKQYNKEHRKKRNEYYRKVRINNIERFREYERERKYLKRYDITTSQKQEILNSQNNHCKICGVEVGMKTGQIDHDHKNVKIRGILCIHCNLGLGSFHDNPSELQRAIDYLRENK